MSETKEAKEYFKNEWNFQHIKDISIEGEFQNTKNSVLIMSPKDLWKTMQSFSTHQNTQLSNQLEGVLEENRKLKISLQDFVNEKKGLFSYIKLPPKERLEFAEQLLKDLEQSK